MMRRYQCQVFAGETTPYIAPTPIRALRTQFQHNNANGVDRDSADYSSHVAYSARNVDAGSFPHTHPIHLISLFYEMVVDISQSTCHGTGTWTPQWQRNRLASSPILGSRLKCHIVDEAIRLTLAIAALAVYHPVLGSRDNISSCSGQPSTGFAPA
ncbi:hypothetical protein VTO73DRAFT_10438 [Trametes versicolor]